MIPVQPPTRAVDPPFDRAARLTSPQVTWLQRPRSSDPGPLPRPASRWTEQPRAAQRRQIGSDTLGSPWMLAVWSRSASSRKSSRKLAVNEAAM